MTCLLDVYLGAWGRMKLPGTLIDQLPDMLA